MDFSPLTTSILNLNETPYTDTVYPYINPEASPKILSFPRNSEYESDFSSINLNWMPSTSSNKFKEGMEATDAVETTIDDMETAQLLSKKQNMTENDAEDYNSDETTDLSAPSPCILIEDHRKRPRGRRGRDKEMLGKYPKKSQ